MKRTKWIALVAAIVATIAVWQIMSSQMRRQEAELDYRMVVVAEGEIQKGEVIQSGKLGVRKVPRQYTPPTALERLGDAFGKVAQSAIAQGEVITPERLSNPESGQAGLAYKIPDGNKAITLTIGVESGVAGMILPGNKVDIMITLPDKIGVTETANPAETANTAEPVDPGLSPEGVPEMPQLTGTSSSTIYLLEDVYVLACGRFMSPDETIKAVSQAGQLMDSVTLSVTSEEARQVELFTYIAKQSGGNIRFVLRSAQQESETQGAEPGGPENDIEEQN